MTNLVPMTTSEFDRVGNISGKGENAGYQQFLLFPDDSDSLLFLGHENLGSTLFDSSIGHFLYGNFLPVTSDSSQKK